jgi:hypothetical protein
LVHCVPSDEDVSSSAVAWHVQTEVEFAPLSEAVIRAYIATGEPMYVDEEMNDGSASIPVVKNNAFNLSSLKFVMMLLMITGRIMLSIH